MYVYFMCIPAGPVRLGWSGRSGRWIYIYIYIYLYLYIPGREVTVGQSLLVCYPCAGHSIIETKGATNIANLYKVFGPHPPPQGNVALG